MNFSELINAVNAITPEDQNQIKEIVNNIDINQDNFDGWADSVFSEEVEKFDMGKLPYLIDELYQTTDKLKFMLCCMLLESTCDKLEFVTNLENYPLIVGKYKTLVHTIVTVYENVRNGISDCMALIVLKNDPKFEYFNDEQKNIMLNATKDRLQKILNYLKTEDIDPKVYDAIEVIADLACYLNDNEISNLIDEIDKLGDNGTADIFIIKYKAINSIDIIPEKVSKLKNDDTKLWLLYNILEELGLNEKYLGDVSQESLAKSHMIRWLTYPTELGDAPDKIELLGEFMYKNTKCFAYKFSKKDFQVKGDMLGVVGGYPIDKVSSISSGYTFSKFEKVEDDWKKQANDLVKFISGYWKTQAQNDAIISFFQKHKNIIGNIVAILIVIAFIVAMYYYTGQYNANGG